MPKNPYFTNIPKRTFVPSSSASPAHFLLKRHPINDTADTEVKKHAWTIGISPLHLRGLSTIAKLFGKRQETIRMWYEQGAPIAYIDTSYCSEYNQLFAWLLNFYQYQD